MAARKPGVAQVCSECGAKLELRSTRCPLCGTESGSEVAVGPPDIEQYQDNVRQLREELIRLRGEHKRAG